MPQVFLEPSDKGLLSGASAGGGGEPTGYQASKPHGISSGPNGSEWLPPVTPATHRQWIWFLY